MINKKLENFVEKANSRLQSEIDEIDKPNQVNGFIEAYVKDNKYKLRKIASMHVVNDRQKRIVDMICRELSNANIYNINRKVVEKSLGKIGIHSVEYLVFQLTILFYIPMMVISAMVMYKSDLKLIEVVIFGLIQIIFILIALMISLVMYVCIEGTKFRLFRVK